MSKSLLTLVAAVTLAACSGRVVRLDHGGAVEGGAAGAAATDTALPSALTELQSIELSESPVLSALQVDDQRVYFLTGNGKLQSCLKTGCAHSLVTYSELAPLPHFALAAGQIAWVDDFKVGGIFLCEKSGCDAPGIRLLFDDSRLDRDTGLSFGNGSIYWLSRQGVYQCEITGCGGLPSVSALGEGSLPQFFGQAAYWVTHDYPFERIRSTTSASAVPETLFESAVDPPAPLSSIREAVMTDQYVYWLDGGSRLLRCPASGCAGASPQLVADTHAQRTDLRADVQGVYWLERDTETATGASLRYCPHDACDAPQSFDQLGAITKYALDDEAIFAIEVVGDQEQTYPDGRYYPGSLKRLAK